MSWSLQGRTWSITPISSGMIGYLEPLRASQHGICLLRTHVQPLLLVSRLHSSALADWQLHHTFSIFEIVNFKLGGWHCHDDGGRRGLVSIFMALIHRASSLPSHLPSAKHIQSQSALGCISSFSREKNLCFLLPIPRIALFVHPWQNLPYLQYITLLTVFLAPMFW